MISQHIILTFLTYFPVYAFLGWCLEVVYASVNTGKFVNRGFLNGAVCPIYGLGASLLILLLTPLVDNVALLYLISVLIASLLELVGGYLLEKLFHMRWWDYSDEPFNIGGFICLKFSLLWGLAGVFLMKIIQPGISHLLFKLPILPVILLLIVFYLVFVSDITVTVIAISHLNRDLKQVHELSRMIRHGSDSLAENIGTLAVDAADKFEAQKAEFEKQKEELLSKRSHVRTRLLTAFPKAKHDTEAKALASMRKAYDSYKKNNS
ncbi:putative ABC transporter permease [Lactococcus insecticola]|uniref:Membrane protein n=1 Tax=Pseudolactococcus insecticola TaxID=2709158 RepID=A0A6A0B7R4_9LACT|nr:putative ABC transporter permease [Lactococcus insecticola]GFH41332.1 membrane protein [Lactococcus insecticola]